MRDAIVTPSTTHSDHDPTRAWQLGACLVATGTALASLTPLAQDAAGALSIPILAPPAAAITSAALCWLAAWRGRATPTEESLWRGIAAGFALMSLCVPLHSALAVLGGTNGASKFVCLVLVLVITGAFLPQHAGINAWHQERSEQRARIDRHELLVGLAAVVVTLAVLNVGVLVVAWVAATAPGYLLVFIDGQPAPAAASAGPSWVQLQPALAVTATCLVRAQALVTVARARGIAADVRIWLFVMASLVTTLGCAHDVVLSATGTPSFTGQALAAPMSITLLCAAAVLRPSRIARPVVTPEHAATIGAFAVLLMAVTVLAGGAVALASLDAEALDVVHDVSAFVLTAVICAIIAAALASTRLLLNLRHLRWSVISERLATTDELTGLANRRGLLKALQDACDEGTAVGLALLDLDKFKEVNDGLGHAAGDELLQQVARRLQSVTPSGDHELSRTLARLGGDEFVVLVTTREALLPAAVMAAPEAMAAAWGQRLVMLFEQPFAVHGAVVHVHASTGVAVLGSTTRTPSAPSPGQGGNAVSDSAQRTPSELLRRVDAAMYEAKGGHDVRSRAVVYDSARHDEATSRLSLAEALRAGLAAGDLEVHYQPQVDVRSGRLAGLEALVRWRHPQRGSISPATIVAVAEAYGLMGALTDFVLGNALPQGARWQRSLPCHGAQADWRLSVNISASSLLDETFPSRIQHLLTQSAFDPHHLVLEITESVLVSDLGRSLRILGQIALLGVEISIDDFGTGFSSLTQLAILPAHEVKLDRAFTVGLGKDRRTDAIIAATVTLAHELGMRVIAEGVEDGAALVALSRLGCDVTQGYLHSPAMGADDITGWITSMPISPPPALRSMSAP